MRWNYWCYTMPSHLQAILRGRRLEREMNEELQFHLDQKTDDGIAHGLSLDEARRMAMRAMEGLEQRKEEMRDMRRIHWVADFVDDARYAIRSLKRTPGFAVFVVTTLALGIGVTSSVYSILDAMLFRPYPVPHPSGVMTLVSTSHDLSFDSFSYREYKDIRSSDTSYAGVVASADMGPVAYSPDARTSPRIKGGEMVSGNFFHVLGVQPRVGRTFRENEDQVPGRDAVVVLGPDFWKNELSSDPSILGKTIRLNGTEFTVIGVAPQTFPGMNIFSHPDFYMPLAMARVFSTNARKNFFEDRDDRELTIRARLKPGVALWQARGELAMLAKNFEREYPKANRGRGATVHTQFEMRTQQDDGNWKFAVIFGILALAVLLVACTNVAGLLLSRARARTREIAVRLAIGSGRFRLVRLLVTESLILASLGGLGGVAVCFAFMKWFHSYQSVIFMTDLPLSIPFQIDRRVLLVSLGLTLLSAILCGLTPALQSTRTDLVNGLKSSDVDMPGRRRFWGRNLLVVAQVSASLMLLIASFALARGFQKAAIAATGFTKDHLLMVSFDPRLVHYDAEKSQQFYKLLSERVRVTPRVRSAALTQNIPLGGDDWDSLAFVPDGFPLPRDRENFNATLDTVDEGYFQTMGVPILRGRGFRATDTADAPRVVVINQQFAKHYWPGVDPVGKRIRLDSRTGATVEIVGVAQTIAYRATTERPIDFAYLPLAQHPIPRMVLMLRASVDPHQLLKPVKDLVRTLDPNMPMLDTRSYEEYYLNQVVEGPGVAIKLVACMSAVGFLLAIAGLYGLIAYNVSRRTREIGIRMAIGADRENVLRLMLRQGVLLVAVGTVIGLGMGFAVERLLNSMLFEADRIDFVVYAVVVPSMFLVTMLAAYLPARRASLIPPTSALRYE